MSIKKITLSELKELIKEVLRDSDGDYKMDHTAPGKNNAPIYNLTGTYPDDIYSSEGARYYGDGTSYDTLSINIIKSVRNKPEAPVRIYRAVPKIITNEEKIEDYKKQKAYILKYGKIPPSIKNWGNRSEYYEYISNEIEKLSNNPEPENKIGINSGDWVTINKAYAIEHGKGNLVGKYRILTKVVPAKTLYSDGGSIHEWGYNK